MRCAPLAEPAVLGGFASDRAVALHQEEPGDLLEPRKGDLVATSSRLDSS
jgi:hypothetical protein